MKIKNIAFDMGGVLLNIDYNLTRQAFINLGITNFDDYYSQTHANPLFADLERGLVSTEEFYKLFTRQSGEPFTTREIDDAWCAMLGTFKESALAFVENLRQDYNVYLLSNTNIIHYEALLRIHQQQFGNTVFDKRFDTVYFSHHIHHRKPDEVAYTTMLEKSNLKPEETLFIDDTYKNLPPAQALGIQVLYLQNGEPVEKAVANLLQN